MIRSLLTGKQQSKIERQDMKYKLLLLLLWSGLSPLYAQTTLSEQIKTVIQGKEAQIGVAVLYDGQKLVSVNDGSPYAMMSTFKFPLALAVADHLDQHQLSLDTPIFVPKSDLHPNTYSPMRDARPEGNFHMPIRKLLYYSIALSDNNACDILIKYIGGTETIQQYLQKLGIRDMNICVTEDEMHQETGNPYLNHTTPSAAVRLLERFLEKDLFSSVYQDFPEKTMIETSTGKDKLKGLLPATVVVGHKTGSSDRDASGMKIADNDMGFVYLPNGKHYTIAVFVMNSMEDDQTNASIIARISKIVYDYYNH